MMTKQNKRMAVVALEDRSGRIEVTLFSDLYQHVMSALDTNTIFIIKGTVAADDYTGGVRVIAENIISLDKAREQMAKRLLIRIETKEQVDCLLSDLPAIIKAYAGGRCPVSVAYQGDGAGAEILLGESWRVKPNDELLTKLSQLCGSGNVFVEY